MIRVAVLLDSFSPGRLRLFLPTARLAEFGEGDLKADLGGHALGLLEGASRPLGDQPIKRLLRAPDQFLKFGFGLALNIHHIYIHLPSLPYRKRPLPASSR